MAPFVEDPGLSRAAPGARSRDGTVGGRDEERSMDGYDVGAFPTGRGMPGPRYGGRERTVA